MAILAVGGYAFLIDDEICQIIGGTLAYDVDDQRYPKEWTFDKFGSPCCTAFIEAGQPIPRRCEKTVDMFEVAA